jgi:sugar lactone lactonase YvrE
LNFQTVTMRMETGTPFAIAKSMRACVVVLVSLLFAAEVAAADYSIRTASGTSLSYPTGVASDSSSNIVVADSNNHAIRRIAPDGSISTLLGGSSGSPLQMPSGVAVDLAGNVFIADTANCVIRRLTPQGGLTTIAGIVGKCGYLDGPISIAQFSFPTGLTVDIDGTVFVADRSNHIIRRISTDGIVTTWAGAPGAPGMTDGRGLDAQFFQPFSIALDAAGNLYVADAGNHVIRMINRERIVTTFCGTPQGRGGTDGHCSVARFSRPSGIAAAADGTFVVADTESHAIRLIAVDGTVSTIAGRPGTAAMADGRATDAAFNHPFGVTVAPSGVIYIADMLNHSVRIAERAAPAPPTRRRGARR